MARVGTLPWMETHLVWDCILALVFSLLPKCIDLLLETNREEVT